MTLVDRFVQWYLQKKQGEKKAVEDQKLVDAYHKLNELYEFVKFLKTKAFTNRTERKRFWKDVLDDKPVVSDILNRMLQAYGVKSETIKKLEDARIAKMVEDTKKDLEKNA